MKCPYCKNIESKVVDSRPTDEGETIRRRRQCTECKERYTTYERIETVPIVVVKKDGTIESYNRDKILKGIIRACEKRPVPLAVIEKAVDNIEREIFNTLNQELSSDYIGELVMEELKSIDEVSYVRFASVYRQFKDINSFLDELKVFMKETDIHE